MQIAVFELIINFISSYFLMIKFGIIGIAVGTLIAFYAEKTLLIVFVKRNLKVNLNEYLAVNRWIIYSLVLFLVYFLTYTLSY